MEQAGVGRYEHAGTGMGAAAGATIGTGKKEGSVAEDGVCGRGGKEAAGGCGAEVEVVEGFAESS